MTYASATITGSANGPADLRTIVETLMVAQGNWGAAPVDTYTSAGYNGRVWKNNGAGNSYGTSFYMAMITYTGQPNTLFIKPFEDYTVATHLGIRGIGYASNFDSATGTCYGNTGYIPESSNWYPHGVTTSSAVFGYRVRVTANGVFCMTSIGTVPGLYSGLFNPIWTHANEFPLISSYVGSNSGYPGFTRRPGMSSSYAGAWDVQGNTAPFFDQPYGSLGTPDVMCGSRVYASRVASKMSNTITGSSELTRGYLDTDLMMVKPDAAVAVGDTLTINSLPYVCVFDGGTASAIFVRTD